jgi:hypothetical protein
MNNNAFLMNTIPYVLFHMFYSSVFNDDES